MFRVLDAFGREKLNSIPGATVYQLTTTGTINDLDFGNASVIRATNATLTTLQGLKAGIYDGQTVLVISRGAGQIDLAHQNASSSAANRLLNIVTSAPTSLAAGQGRALYVYDLTSARWILAEHEQGGWITEVYASGNYTANGSMSWTVQSADVSTDAYYLKGNVLFRMLSLGTTSVGGTPSTQLKRKIPGGFSCAVEADNFISVIDNNSARRTGLVDIQPATSQELFFTDLTAGTNWAASTNLTNIGGQYWLQVT